MTHAENQPGDRIELRGLKTLAIVGLLEHERKAPQPLEIDLDIYADLTKAQQSDEVSDTLDYATVARLAVQVCQSSGAKLLERLAHQVAEEICRQPGVIEVSATVKKLRPPVDQHLDTAGVRATVTA